MAGLHEPVKGKRRNLRELVTVLPASGTRCRRALFANFASRIGAMNTVC
jgi:hypothetical protein